MEKLKLNKCLKAMLLLVSMIMISGTIFAQTITLRGKVVDVNGEGLIGADVKVTASAATHVTTNISGDFTLRVPAGTTKITITYVGYVTLDVAITPKSGDLGNITLAQDANSLSEVVVVGYGSQVKRDVTGATVTIDEKSLAEVPAGNVVSQLEGKVAGLDVSGGVMRIRGNRTIGSSPQGGQDAPLIVVDGVPYSGSLSDVNPQDIKNVEVLKDASATAIYGSRGSGGVILITTNRGRVGQAFTTLNNYYGVSNVLNELHVNNAAQYQAEKIAGIEGQTIQGLQATNSTYGLSPAETAGIAAGTNTDWQKLLYQSAYVADQTLGVSGGTESTQFVVNAGYRVTTGVEPLNRNERYSLQMEIDQKVSRTIRIGANMTNTLSYANSPSGNQTNAIQISPLLAPYNADGSLNVTPWLGLTESAYPNPLYTKYNGSAFYNNTRSFHDFTNLYAEWSILKDLKYKFTVGYDFQQSLNQSYNGINGTGITNQAQTNASVSNSSSYKYTLDNLITYDKTFGQKHHITFTGLFSVEKNHNDSSNLSATNIPSDVNQATNLSLGTFQGDGGSYSETGLVSEMARLNYAYSNLYSLTATVRQDANSTLAAGHQYLAYPAVGAAWNISNEKWMQQYNWVNNLKLRGGYGVTSNGPLGGAAYQTLGGLSSSSPNGNGTLKYEYGSIASGNSSGLLVGSLVNPSLTWQKTGEWNIGFDFGILKNRLTGSIDVYTQKTTDILLNNVLPASSGVTSQQSNLGTSADKGLEIALTSINIQNKSGFGWTTDFNIAFSREQIIALPNGITANIGSGEFVGWPLNVIYDAKKIGIWQISDSPGIDNSKSQASGPVYLPVSAQSSPKQYPGQIRVADLNGDGVINSNDNQILGTFQPQYIFGITNRFSYKGIDISIVINARMGMEAVVPYLSTGGSAGGYAFLWTTRHNEPVTNYWTPANPTGTFPEPNQAQQTFNYASTTQYYDGSWIKARSINVGYTIPSRFLSKVGINSLRLYANCTNPFVIYAPIRKVADGMDPEGGGVAAVGSTTSGSDPRAQGLSINENTRTYQIGLNLKF